MYCYGFDRHERQKMEADSTMTGRCVLNVSGTKLDVDEKTFLKLSPSLKKGGYFNGNDIPEELYIGRNVACFQSILNYYQCGDLHLPVSVCPGIFKSEMEFWGLRETSISKCCNYKYFGFLEMYTALEKFENYTASWMNPVTHTKRGQKTIKDHIWDFLDNPYSSRKAKGYLGVLTFFIVFSIGLMCFSTNDIAYRQLTEKEYAEYFGDDLSAHYEYLYDLFGPDFFYDYFDGLSNETGNYTNDASNNGADVKPRAKLTAVISLEYVCIVFFTVDLLLRFVFCPSLRRCFTEIATIVDIIALVGMYVRVLVINFVQMEKYRNTSINTIDVLSVARICRLVRILCHIKNLRVLVYSLKISLTHLLHMMILLCGLVVFFSTVLYVCEDEDVIPSIPYAFWWGVITMTTVGYGDVVPKTISGKITGGLCSIMGVIMLALIIAIVVNNFVSFSDFAKADYGPVFGTGGAGIRPSESEKNEHQLRVHISTTQEKNTKKIKLAKLF